MSIARPYARATRVRLPMAETSNMPKTLPLLLLTMVVGLTGCRNTCLQTAMRMTSDVAITKDVTPLREHTVLPGACDCKVALIDVDGVLLNANQTGISSVGENPVEMFREKLDTIARSGCYCAVVVRINSPGGGVTASDMMRRDLEAFKNRTGLPVIACLMDVGAGGAYYLATACDQIVAHPTTVTGGLGVVLNIYDMQDTLQQINVVTKSIRIGQHVDLGSPVHTLEDEGKQILTTVAYEFHQRFQRHIIEARALDVNTLNAQLERLPTPAGEEPAATDAEEPAGDADAEAEAADRSGDESYGDEDEEVKVDAVFDGRVFTANQALQLGLIDGIGYVDDALQVARGLGGAPNARAVILHRWRDPARTPYSITPNTPRSDLLPLSIPGLERSRLPTFLYMWQPDPSLEKWGGR
ncbi:MAG: S49 family peptidase [Planctomycetales bacterium]|nr:S49 family peptidase [Planctomycetales bacterium]